MITPSVHPQLGHACHGNSHRGNPGTPPTTAPPQIQEDLEPIISKWTGTPVQGIFKGCKCLKQQRVEGTDIFWIIRHKDTPHNSRNKITDTKVVWDYRSHKEDPNRMRITIGGNRICYPGDVSAPTGSLELVKIIINMLLSLRHAHFIAFDVSNFYLPRQWIDQSLSKSAWRNSTRVYRWI